MCVLHLGEVRMAFSSSAGALSGGPVRAPADVMMRSDDEVEAYLPDTGQSSRPVIAQRLETFLELYGHRSAVSS